MCAENNIEVDTTTDAYWFTEDSLKKYSAVVFLNTTGDVLNQYQEADFERVHSGRWRVRWHPRAPQIVNTTGDGMENFQVLTS